MLDSWELEGVHSPHDIVLSAAPITATIGGSRSLAVYVAEAARGRASHLHKLIIHHPSEFLPHHYDWHCGTLWQPWCTTCDAQMQARIAEEQFRSFFGTPCALFYKELHSNA